MKLSTNENQTIRQFLLGQLSGQGQEQIEDRIFTDPEFAEEVQIAEHELIADEQAGRLTEAESQSFATRYATKPNRAIVDFEKEFGEFICTKTESVGSVPELRAELRADPPPRQPVTRKATSRSSGFWQRLIPVLGPAVAYPVIAIGFLLLAATIWFVVPRFTHTASAPTRQQIEAELARLNSSGVSPSSVLSTVDLEVAQRYGGALARVTPPASSPDGVLEFYLNLTEMNKKKYRAVVFDDQHQELFAIPNLTAQDSKAGPRIRLFIPIKYLNRGDYQIDLSVANDAGGYDQVNSYAFRVVDHR